MLRYALRDLVRNPGRSLPAIAAVTLAVGLLAATSFFVDASAATMTRRALAPVALDMQLGLNQPLASPLALTEKVDSASLTAGQAATVKLTIANGFRHALTGVVVREDVMAPLTYVAGSTALDTRPLVDVGGEPPLLSGIGISTLAAGVQAVVTYRVTAAAAIPATAALTSPATVTAVEEPGPVSANLPAAVDLTALGARLLRLPGVTGVEQVGMVDLGPGSLRLGARTVSQPVRVLAIDPAYLSHYSLVRVSTGTYGPDGALLSPDAAGALGSAAGAGVQLVVPGRATPIQLTVTGTADLSAAGPLFASRAADTQGEFAGLSNVIVLPLAAFNDQVLPALRADAASAAPQLKTAPVQELDLRLDRSRLNADPTVAVVTSQGLKRTLERIAPGQVTVIDNLSDTLLAARGDAILAKVLLLFLGLPGVLLAGYLARYASSLLSQARRREQATLRARGAQPRHLVGALTYTSAGVGLAGSLLGLVAGAGAVAVLVGPSAFSAASASGVLLSAGLAVAAGLLVTGLALYLPGRQALWREAAEERRELPVAGPPLWLRLRLDLVLIAVAGLVWGVTVLGGGFRPTPAEGQSLSLSFYTLLAPLLGWLGATLLGVRALLMAAGRLAARRPATFGGPVGGALRRSLQRRPLAPAAGAVAVALAVAFGSSLAFFTATYDAQKLADARFVIGGDLRVTPSAASPQTGTLAPQLKVAGVSRVTAEAVTNSALVGNDKKTLVAIDPAALPSVATIPDSFFAGSTAAAAMSALRQDPSAVLVATEMARSYNIQPGDQVKIELTGPGGRPVPVTLRAAGFFTNFPGYPQGIDLVGSLAFYQSATGSQLLDEYFLRTADQSPAGVAAVARELQNGPGHGGSLLVETTATAINRDASSLTALNLRGLGSLESTFAVVMSAIAVAIFVIGLLLQRRKEYVTMRALGMAAGHLRLVLLGEVGAVGVAGLALGLAIGAGMAAMFVAVLAPLFSIPPSSLTVPGGELLVLALLLLGSMGVAVLGAGRSVQRLNPAEILREE